MGRSNTLIRIPLLWATVNANSVAKEFRDDYICPCGHYDLILRSILNAMGIANLEQWCKQRTECTVKYWAGYIELRR